MEHEQLHYTDLHSSFLARLHEDLCPIDVDAVEQFTVVGGGGGGGRVEHNRHTSQCRKEILFEKENKITHIHTCKTHTCLHMHACIHTHTHTHTHTDTHTHAPTSFEHRSPVKNVTLSSWKVCRRSNTCTW